MENITTPTIETPVISEKPKTNYLTIVFISVAFILFLAGAYLLGQQSVKPIETPVTIPTTSQIVTLPKPTIVPTTNIDSTVNWKTYTYLKSNIDFSFKYPTNYNVNSGPEVSQLSPTDTTITSISFEFTSLDKSNHEDIVLEIVRADRSLDSYVQKFAASELVPKKISAPFNPTLWLGYSKNIPTLYLSFVKSGYIYNLGALNATDSTGSQLLIQILSTFKFTENKTITPTSNQSLTKSIKYNLPQNWLSVRDNSQLFEVGYNPTTQEPKMSTDDIIIFNKITDTNQYLSLLSRYEIVDYDGGSRHTFLYSYFNGKLTSQDKFPNYKEVEYRIDGKNCLFLDGISYSQSPSVWGICPMSSSKALLITTWDRENYSKNLSTLKFKI